MHQGPDVPYQLYGGTLDGVAEHLDHLVDLGATLLYLTPFFEARSNHRYDAATFDEVDPVLGGDAALQRLVDAAHAPGLRVVGDLTTNHTGEAPVVPQGAGRPRPRPSAPSTASTTSATSAGWACPPCPSSTTGRASCGAALRRPDSVVARWLRAGWTAGGSTWPT